MGEVCDDFLELYRQFFDRFAQSVDPSDQLPVKVASYNLTQAEIPGAVGDWALQYLEQRKCPPFLIAHLISLVKEEVRALCKADPDSCGYRSDISGFLSLRLMHACVDKLIEVCARYRDNAALSSLPPPPSNPLPVVTTYAVKNCRRSMEDRLVVIHDFHGLFNIKNQGPASYYGVFDGHNGTDAAIYSVSHLHQYLAESAYYPSNPLRAIRDASIKTDECFCDKAERENLHGGTTAVFALLRPKEHKLYVAWIGDSQAVLVRQGRPPIQIVRPHKPDRPDERMRIESTGGAVVYWGAWRVNGQLAVSRAIGDIEYKPYVTAEPDVEEITLNGTEDFLILACDGLWDFVSEEQATNAVYKQLQEDSGDLAAVSHRLVALAKEQSSQDNISVVVVFLASPTEVARRRVMETASPNPFVVRQNGADAIFRGGVTNGVDDEDFGPETDVDMVDDVLLSPAIAAAKALVAGCHSVEDDLERQRQQLADFDDPADLDPSRDTPTPPAHEVAGSANAESGGEESEEEWNYIPGKDTKTEIDTQEQEDMSSQLNPNAAEFVPVSPTKLLMMDDAIISASPRMGFEKSMDNVLVPSEIEFNDEVSRRPSDLGITNGPKPKHGDNYFMRDNFSTLRNKSPDLNSTSTCAQLGDDSIVSLSSSVNNSAVCASEDVPPFDKLEALQNLNESKDLFGSDTDFSNNAFGITKVLDKHNHLSTSEIEHELMQSPEIEDNPLPGTPKSTIVEAPVSPSNEEEFPLNHQTDFDSPIDDNLTSPQKSSDVVSESALALGQERKTSSSGFESDNGAEEGENNIAEESNEGFVTEHRRSPPIDLSFKPIQTFSDTNPFGALQTPSSTTPLDHNEMSTHIKTEESEVHDETPQKSSSENIRQGPHLSFNDNTPSSFISARQKTPFDEPVPFNELESPTEIPQFELPPNANSSMLASELPKSPNPDHSNFEEMVSSNKEYLESEIENVKSNHLHSEQLDLEESSPKYEETSFTTDIESHKEAIISSVDLDTTAGFLHEESNILKDEKVSEQAKLVSSTHTAEEDLLHMDNSTREVEPNFIDECNVAESEFEPHPAIKDSDVESETREMNLEFESHIPSQKTISEDLVSSDDGFEVISKEELKIDDINAPKEHVKEELSITNLQSSELNETPLSQHDEQKNPLDNDEHQLPIIDTPAKSEENKEESLASYATSVNNFMNVFENVNSAKQDIQSSEKSEILSPTLEPQVLKTESYQLLTPADEPICTKTVVPVTEDKKPLIDDEIKTEQQIEDILEVKEVDQIAQDQAESCPRSKVNLEVDLDIIPSDISLSKDEPVLSKSEPVQSQVVTETLITALEETSEVPSLATTEVPSTAGTPPPTPIPTEADSKDDAKKTDLLVAAVAAAGAVATGAVLAADKAKKETSKKPIAAASKKPNESTVKAPTKPALSKAPASKPAAATKTTTTKPATAATKPTGPSLKPAGPPSKPTTTGPKPAPTKPASAPVATKKPAALTKPATAKPASTSSPKPASTSSPKPATTSAPKTVPKHLPVNKTATPLKSTSKPTTPTTSKPTTPTAPKSPSVMKTDVKSPARPAVKSTLTASRPTSTAKSPTEESVEKKPMTNGDVKPAVKKVADVVAKKPSTTSSKPLATTRPSAPVSKTAPVAKAPTSAGAKPLASRPASTVPPKTKPSTTAATKPTVPPPIKRPTSGTAAKTADKTGKDIANKQLSNAKAVNGKVVPSKTVNSVKKTDAKINGKTADKPSKNPEEVHAENESPAVVQEDNVTTTNGFGEHDHVIEENGSMKIEELNPVILENVN